MDCGLQNKTVFLRAWRKEQRSILLDVDLPVLRAPSHPFPLHCPRLGSPDVRRAGLRLQVAYPAE